MVDALCIEKGRAALDAVHDIILGEKELGEVRAVLPRDAGDERNFARHASGIRCQRRGRILVELAWQAARRTATLAPLVACCTFELAKASPSSAPYNRAG